MTAPTWPSTQADSSRGMAAAIRMRIALFLAAARAVEDDPSGEIVAEVLEPVLDARGDEQRVAGGEVLALAGHDEIAAAGDHEIDFVAIVRGLRVTADRSIDFDDEA